MNFITDTSTTKKEVRKWSKLCIFSFLKKHPYFIILSQRNSLTIILSYHWQEIYQRWFWKKAQPNEETVKIHHALHWNIPMKYWSLVRISNRTKQAFTGWQRAREASIPPTSKLSRLWLTNRWRIISVPNASIPIFACWPNQIHFCEL